MNAHLFARPQPLRALGATQGIDARAAESLSLERRLEEVLFASKMPLLERAEHCVKMLHAVQSQTLFLQPHSLGQPVPQLPAALTPA